MIDAVQKIRDLYAAEAACGKHATGPSDIPFSYESITPEWMSHVLCKGHAKAKVVRIELDEKDEGTTNRRRIFVTYNEAGTGLGLPSSVFCKATHGLNNRLMLGLNGGVYCEVTFYEKIRPQLELDVPSAFLATYDPESFNSIIVLEDLGRSVEFCRHWTPISLHEAMSQLALLASFHGKLLSNASFNSRTLGIVTWPQFFAAVEQYGHEAATENGFLAAEEVIPPRLFARQDEIWNATRFAVHAHETLPATLLHGDCHLKQWYKRRDTGTLGLTDWQCCTFGHWARDVSYVIGTSLSVENRRSWERELLAFYLQQLAQSGAEATSFDTAWTLYRQNLLPALSWWTGTLTPQPDAPDMQPRETSMEFIGRLTHAIDDLDALAVCTP